MLREWSRRLRTSTWVRVPAKGRVAVHGCETESAFSGPYAWFRQQLLVGRAALGWTVPCRLWTLEVHLRTTSGHELTLTLSFPLGQRRFLAVMHAALGAKLDP